MQSNNQPNTTEQFLKLPYDVLDATGFIAKGGEIVNITLQQKIVYCWMKQRCEFFAKDGREYFDNVDDIADSLKINRKTVLGAIQFFRDNGVLIADKKPLGGAREKWVFKRFCDISFVNTKDKEKAPVQAKEQPTQAPQELAAPTMDDFVPAGAEWASEAVPMDAYDDFMPEPEDDGSYADALSYSEQEEDKPCSSVKQPKPDVPETIHGVSLADMPTRRFQPNGDVSAEMVEWCARKNVKIFEAEYDVQFLIQGIPHVFNNNTFVPCSSKPARKQMVEEFESPF
ncbi:hypothetical protein KVH38_03310 [Stutzerimonas stutzeri]|uniref:hypothetical protein n=1 Tax=Stutzerimonas stutzeri TaxID=316 RepID=UPI001C4D053D|nr:hypothetical protein [Stutzerimonas stutzeri]QXP26337.1 hypothetical protein KVH38_03310 [Stutzerimonas stutzeri]